MSGPRRTSYTAASTCGTGAATSSSGSRRRTPRRGPRSLPGRANAPSPRHRAARGRDGRRRLRVRIERALLGQPEILPVLRQYRMTATFYVITGRTHEQGFLNPDQIRQLEAAGMDIGAHTRTHVSLPALPPAALRSEVDGSAGDLRGILGHPVYWFAYPYGAFNDAVVREVRRAGFLLAVTTRAGETASTDAPLEIPRIHVGRAATASTVLGLLGGGAAPRAPAGAG